MTKYRIKKVFSTNNNHYIYIPQYRFMLMWFNIKEDLFRFNNKYKSIEAYNRQYKYRDCLILGIDVLIEEIMFFTSFEEANNYINEYKEQLIINENELYNKKITKLKNKNSIINL